MNMSLVYPSFSNAGMMANLIMGGGPHRRICVSFPGGGMCFWIISAEMNPVSYDHFAQGQSSSSSSSLSCSFFRSFF